VYNGEKLFGEGRPMIQVPAVFENGVLKPLAPVKLTEGQRVIIQIRLQGKEALEELWSRPSPFPLTPEHEAYRERLKTAKTFQEFLEVVRTAPPDPEPSDLGVDFDANQKASGTYRISFPDQESRDAS
jgi:predicted DNA-binding antitoxin AbrB/MazE fold protein